MQIILMEKVVNLGGLGDVVKVKDGFARNYLIPQGKAKRATQKNLKEFEDRRVDLEKKANEALASSQERGAKLEGMKIDIAQKAGVDGRLFGSVTNADIAEALGKQGVEVKKAEIESVLKEADNIRGRGGSYESIPQINSNVVIEELLRNVEIIEQGADVAGAHVDPVAIGRRPAERRGNVHGHRHRWVPSG